MKDRFLIGESFGHWTIIGIDEVGTKPNRKVILKCRCGNAGRATKSDLNKGRTTKCRQCSFKETYRKPNNEAAINRFYGSYITNARTHQRAFDIDRSEFEVLIQKDCHYCQSKPQRKLQSNWDTVYANGLDRIDSSIGYTIENVMTCCWDCNRMKGDMSYEQFVEHITKIATTLTHR